MEKFDDSSGDEENYFNELRNFSSRFCRASTRGDLLNEKLNQLVEQRHSALGYGPKQQQTGMVTNFKDNRVFLRFNKGNLSNSSSF